MSQTHATHPDPPIPYTGEEGPTVASRRGRREWAERT